MMITVGRLLKSIPIADKTNSFFTMLYMAKAFDVELFLFAPKDVNYENETINGLFFEKGKVVRRVVPIPPLIDNQFNIIDKELSKYALLTRRSIGLSKYTTYTALRDDGKYKDILIPTYIIDNYSDIEKLLEEFGGQTVIKPANGQNGAGVLKVSKVDGQFLLLEGKKSSSLSEQEFKDYCDKNFGKKHLMQPLIDCRTKNGEPFDIRVRSVRGANAKFVVNLYPRVGAADGIISNIHAGGYSIPTEFFLKNEFGELWKDIRDDLLKLGREFPAYYQNFCRNNIFEIGIDVGITKTDNGYKFWLFEANSFPNGTIHLGGNVGTHLVIAYFEYFHYLYNNFIIEN